METILLVANWKSQVMKDGKPRRGPSMPEKHISLLGASGSRTRHVQIFGYGLGRPTWSCELAQPVTTLQQTWPTLPGYESLATWTAHWRSFCCKVLRWLPGGLGLLLAPEAVDWPKVPAKLGTLDLVGERVFFFFAVDLLRSRKSACESSKLKVAFIKTSNASFSTMLTEGGSKPIPMLPSIHRLARES
jgi:hypothetical protein